MGHWRTEENSAILEKVPGEHRFIGMTAVNFLNDIDHVVRVFTVTYVIAFWFCLSVKKLFTL